MSVKLKTKYLDFELYDTRAVEYVTSDRFGLLVANEWHRLLQKYTPRDAGTLVENVKLESEKSNETLESHVKFDPWEITYLEPYAHYLYEGYLYVDPETGSPYAREGTKKVKTNVPLKYNREKSPYATDHWDIKAANAGQLTKLYQALNKKIQRGDY